MTIFYTRFVRAEATCHENHHRYLAVRAISAEYMRFRRGRCDFGEYVQFWRVRAISARSCDFGEVVRVPIGSGICGSHTHAESQMRKSIPQPRATPFPPPWTSDTLVGA
ncbi:unnamed protein product [Closterium sp. NIES-53]